MSSDNTVTQLRPNQNVSHIDGQSATANAYSQHGGSGGGGGNDMNSRVTRIEAIIESQQQLMRDIRDEMRGIRNDIHNNNSEIKNTERRLLDKVDENHKWVIALIISSILIPMLLALVTK